MRFPCPTTRRSAAGLAFGLTLWTALAAAQPAGLGPLALAGPAAGPTAAATPAAIPAAIPAVAPRHDPDTGLPAHFELVPEIVGVDVPTALTFSDDGRAFIASKRGRVSTWANGVYQQFWVLDRTSEILSTGDRGLIGLALHPGFTPDGGEQSWIYLAYTASGLPGSEIAFDEDGYYSHGMVTRYRVRTVSGGLLIGLPTTRQVLLGERLPDGTAPDALASLHNSHSNGGLAFAPDGSLLLTMGDGAHWDLFDFGGNDPEGFEDYVHPVSGLKGQISLDQDSGAFRCRDLRSLSGKVIRIDPETGLGLPSNPFYDGDPSSLASRIYATGLRNPFRFALRPGTGSTDIADGDPGQLFVGDVGNTDTEEINVILPGHDYGWPVFEGTASEAPFDSYIRPGPNPLNLPDSTTPAPGPVTAPVIAYDHQFSNGLLPIAAHLDVDGNPGGGFVGSCIALGDFYQGGEYPAIYDGALFFADYGSNWLRAATFDAAGTPLEIRDFGIELGNVVDLARDPVSGDLFMIELGIGPANGRLLRLRYGANLSPVAALAVDANAGLAPLLVNFDASASTDPEGDPLTYRFDFGDGSPPVEQSSPLIAHTYVADGTYAASVEVSDDGGLATTDVLTINVGAVAPSVFIDAPTAGQLPPADGQLPLAGGGNDPLGGALTFDWRVDLYHDDHVHPEFWGDTEVAPASTTSSYTIVPHAADGDLYYYNLLLTATTLGGTSATTNVWAVPAGQQVNPVDTALPISSLDGLVPPTPLGLGNADIEVIRDGVRPPVGATDPSLQFDTEHNGDQGDDDWIGIELVSPPESQSRFTKLIFQEGAHSAAGGWFEDVSVEVRVGSTWQPVQDLSVEPAYDGSDPGPGFEQFTFDFAPTWGEAIRLRGTPGGSVGFVSCAELSAEMLHSSAALPEYENLASLGTIISSIGTLLPPFSLGLSNPDPETIRNGTRPQPGSTSLHAQYDTSHNGDQGNLDWIGYRFADARTVERVVFHEGLAQADGGWLETLEVQTRLEPSDPWSTVPTAVIDPSYRGQGPGTLDYESWTIDFEPRVARDVRIVGQPGGSTGYLSVSELQVLGPWWDASSCGITPYGTEWAGNPVALTTATPPLLGYPGHVDATGGAADQLGVMMISPSSLAIPLGAGTLLVDPTFSVNSYFLTDAVGEAAFVYTLPTDPVLSGITLFLQAALQAPSDSDGFRLSHGLELSVCE